MLESMAVKVSKAGTLDLDETTLDERFYHECVISVLNRKSEQRQKIHRIVSSILYSEAKSCHRFNRVNIAYGWPSRKGASETVLVIKPGFFWKRLQLLPINVTLEIFSSAICDEPFRLNLVSPWIVRR